MEISSLDIVVLCVLVYAEGMLFGAVLAIILKELFGE